MDTGSGSRVLIADDMRVNRMILASLLASNGVASDLAQSGAECIELCRTNLYDLILLDQHLTDLSGVDTFFHLKKIFSELGKEIPVICHTAENSDEKKLLYQTAGFAGVLIKPMDPAKLSRILMTWLPEGKEGGITALSDRTDIQKEPELLPDWLRQVPELDPESGLDHCETAEDYIGALTVFYSSISEKSAEIEDFYKKKDYGMYSLRLHSLKSTAGLIGADKLADLASCLEQAGKHNNLRLIREKHMTLITQYRAFFNSLAPLSEDRTDEDA